jgi:xanthine dehydrogenase accessory factor
MFRTSNALRALLSGIDPRRGSAIMRGNPIDPSAPRPVVVVLGCGDVGSAVAHALHRAGCATVLIDDADPAWPRRGMAYVDAWYLGNVELAGVTACFCASVRSVPVVLERGEMIAATTWSWRGVAAALAPIALVDARVAKRSTPARLKPHAPSPLLTIGLGPGYRVGEHVDVAIETAWGARLGSVVEEGGTLAFSGDPRVVGGAGRERFVYAPVGGRFNTACKIGDRVSAGERIAALGGVAIAAPLAGVLRGLSARGARIVPGQKVVEVDPRGDPALCFGLGERPRRIAAGVVEALAMRGIVAGAISA